MMRHSPNSEPKFHQAEIFDGAGRSTSELFMICMIGCVFRIGVIRVFVVE